MRIQFNAIASEWDAMRLPDSFEPYETALAAVDPAPARALDLGTGTGHGAFLIARFEQADASALPYADRSFNLVAHANMIPFFDEVARVLAPGGQALFAFSSGSETPIYVPSERLRAELVRRGFTEFADFTVARGTALLARKGNRA
jgi:ubiquinone/menaquinone biosynthesis C-methylase UbiE